jgi:hypothetical protein
LSMAIGFLLSFGAYVTALQEVTSKKEG